MQITNSELAAHLNQLLGLSGGDAITTNVVRQWVAWDILPKATVVGRTLGRGPIWSRTEVALSRARRLAELRQRGIKREAALVLHAYIEWGHTDFDRVRDALGSEWAKWSAQLNRRQITFLDDEGFSEISASKKRAIANQLGELDHRLKGTQFEQSPELFAVFVEASRTGNFEPSYLQSLLSVAFARIAPALAIGFPPSFVAQIANSFAGMTGSPDEIEGSGLEIIQMANQRQFRIARHQCRLLIRAMHSEKQSAQIEQVSIEARELWQMLKLLGPQITSGPWLIFSFVQALKLTSLK